MRKIIAGKVYDTGTAETIASDRYWDGSNWERHGRNTYLYATPRGAFFRYTTTQWQGERHTITPLSAQEAESLFSDLPEQHEDVYVRFFGEPEEAGDSELNWPFRLRMSQADHDGLKTRAEARGTSMNNLLLELIRQKAD